MKKVNRLEHKNYGTLFTNQIVIRLKFIVLYLFYRSLRNSLILQLSDQ